MNIFIHFKLWTWIFQCGLCICECVYACTCLRVYIYLKCQKIFLCSSRKNLLPHQQCMKFLPCLSPDNTWKDRAFSFLSVLMNLKCYFSTVSVSLSFNEFVNLFIYLALFYVLRYFFYWGCWFSIIDLQEFLCSLDIVSIITAKNISNSVTYQFWPWCPLLSRNPYFYIIKFTSFSLYILYFRLL